MTAPQRPIPTDKGRAYVAWRDAPDLDHTEDDEPIVAFSAGWEARDAISAVTHVADGSGSTEPSLEQVLTAWYTDEARGTHLDFDDLPSLVKRIEAHYASVQPPSREQIAETIDTWWEGTDPDGVMAEDVEALKVDLLALFEQPTPPAVPVSIADIEQEVMARAAATRRAPLAPALQPNPGWNTRPKPEPVSIADMAPGTTSTDAHDEVFQKQVWCFMCPAPSCRLTEYGFAGRQDADNALRDHLVECHD